MKQFFIISFLLFYLCPKLFAQVKPFQWTINATKTGMASYELHFKVQIDSPWHIYSLHTYDFGPVSTKFSLNRNPLVAFQGETKEFGQVQKHVEKAFNIEVYYFEKNAEFVIPIRLRSNVKTVIGGTLEYMICKDDMCLPPFKDSFQIAIQ